jgi:protein-tyrosine phosphatase
VLPSQHQRNENILEKDTLYNFAAASSLDTIVFGAERPGYLYPRTTGAVPEWIAFMRSKGVQRVLCLLPQKQLDDFAPELLTLYQSQFSAVLHIPVQDFLVPTDEALWAGVSFLRASELAAEPVVVHCNAGMGRTGILLSAWLIARHRLSIEDAVRTVKEYAAQRGARRAPFEANEELVVPLLRWVGVRRLP